MDDADPEYTYLDAGEALALHAETKGLSVDLVFQEVRDIGLLQSAMARPYHAAVYGGADLAEQAATLLIGIAQNQPFVDGNKRTSLVVTLTFLEENGYSLELDENALFRLMNDIASGLAVIAVAARLRPALRPILSGDA